MAKITGAGAELQIGTADDGGSTAAGVDSFTAVGNVRSITGPSGEKVEIDVTDNASSGKEFLGGKPDLGEVQFQAWHNDTQATQDTLWADFLDAADQHIRNWKIVLSDGVEYTFQGFVKNLAHAGIEESSGVELNGSVRVSGGMTRTNA